MRNAKSLIPLAPMSRANLAAVLLCILILFTAAFAGCTGTAPAVTQEKAITITGLPSGDITAGMGELKGLRVYEGRAEGANSSGETVAFDVRGAYFSDLLEKHGCSQSELEGIRINAIDGYSIEVGKDILETRDIIIAYEMDGKPLDKENAPFRIFIPGERAMYWVRMVSGIAATQKAAPEEVSGIFIVESLYDSGSYEDYTAAGETYKALDTKNIISGHPGSGGDIVIMTAADGLRKNETLENFYKGAITMSGENSPWFISKSLPAGMFVKRIVLFKYGGNAFYFASAQQEVTLDQLAQQCMLTEAEDYTISFSDGGNITVTAGELPQWTLGISYGETYAAKGEKIYQHPVSIIIKGGSK